MCSFPVQHCTSGWNMMTALAIASKNRLENEAIRYHRRGAL